MSEQFLSVASIFNIVVAAGALMFAAYLLATRPKSRQPGLEVIIPVFGNEIHIKYRRRTRWVEDKRHVPVFRLGYLVISYWSKRMVEREARYQD